MSSFTDESKKLFVGRLLKPDEIEPWVLAQNMGSSPANRVCHHHTYIPTVEQWKGLKSLNAIFRYYERKGWPKGVGPHFFNAPEGIYVATHPRHDGIGVRGHNHRVIHIENVGNYDKKPLAGQMLDNLYILNRALSKNPGIAVNRSTHFFHRDYALKTCPGTANTKELLIAVPALKNEDKPTNKYQITITVRGKDAKQFAQAIKDSCGFPVYPSSDGKTVSTTCILESLLVVEKAARAWKGDYCVKKV